MERRHYLSRVLNITGLVVAIVTGHWYLKQIYAKAYFPIAGAIWLLGLLGRLPRVKASTKGEGHERRYFYGTVWAMCIAQPLLWLMWYVVPETRVGDSIKLLVFLCGRSALVGNLARLGRLPRTRPIVPGETRRFGLDSRLSGSGPDRCLPRLDLSLNAQSPKPEVCK